MGLGSQPGSALADRKPGWPPRGDVRSGAGVLQALALARGPDDRVGESREGPALAAKCSKSLPHLDGRPLPGLLGFHGGSRVLWPRLSSQTPGIGRGGRRSGPKEVGQSARSEEGRLAGEQGNPFSLHGDGPRKAGPLACPSPSWPGVHGRGNGDPCGGFAPEEHPATSGGSRPRFLRWPFPLLLWLRDGPVGRPGSLAFSRACPGALAGPFAWLWRSAARSGASRLSPLRLRRLAGRIVPNRLPDWPCRGLAGRSVPNRRPGPAWPLSWLAFFFFVVCVCWCSWGPSCWGCCYRANLQSHTTPRRPPPTTRGTRGAPHRCPLCPLGPGASRRLEGE